MQWIIMIIKFDDLIRIYQQICIDNWDEPTSIDNYMRYPMIITVRKYIICW